MNYLFKSGQGVHIIPTESLLAVEVNDYLCTFYMENEVPDICIESLQKVLSKLPDCFIRISRNCIINTLHVKSIDYKKRELKLTGGKVFRFSVRNAKTLRKVFGK